MRQLAVFQSRPVSRLRYTQLKHTPADPARTLGALPPHLRCSSSRSHIYHATSRDGGVSWTTALPLALPNPDAKSAVLQVRGFAATGGFPPTGEVT